MMLRSPAQPAAARVLLLLPLFLLAIPALGAPPDVSAPAASPLPAGVEPVGPAVQAELQEMLHEMETLRGLKALRPVPAGTLGEEALRQQMRQAMSEEFKPDQLRSMELGLKAFGLIPESMDLARFLPELMTTQVAGYYDPDKKYLALVRRPTPAKGGQGEGGSKAGRAEHESLFDPKGEGPMVAFHELVHALQDQHFDLHRFESADPASDLSSAYSALVEGDATAMMILEVAGVDISALPTMEKAIGTMIDNPALLEQMADLPAGKAMRDAPPFIRESLLFSYMQGLAFAFGVRHAGGQALLDYAFTTDPPLSTEQILHPEKWFGDRDDPLPLHFPDLASMPAVRQAVEGGGRADGELGELGIRILLRQTLDDRPKADRAASGWGGDHYTAFQQGAARRLAWLTVWDSEGDADEFASAARRLGRDWQVERLAPRRIALLRGGWATKERAELLPALAGMEIPAAANRRIDFAAIGAKPPTLDEAYKKMISGPDAKITGVISADGTTYRNPEAGFALHLPAGREGWSFLLAPVRSAPVNLVQRKLGVSVLVLIAPHGRGTTAEATLPAFEAGLSPAFPGYQRRGGRALAAPGDGAYAFEFKATDTEGVATRGAGEVVVYGEQVFAFIGWGPASSWPAAEAQVRQVFDSLELFPPGPAPAPLAPESGGLARFLPDSRSAKVAGFHDPKRKYLALVRRPELSGADLSRSEPKDNSFMTHPPRSAEQILHPETWLGDRHAPVALGLPALASVPRSLPTHRRIDFAAIFAKPATAEDIPTPSLPEPDAPATRAVSADGATFFNSEAGFAVHVPKEPAGWTLAASEVRASPVTVFNSKLGLSLMAMVVPRQAGMMAEDALPIFEAGFSIAGYQGYLRSGGRARPAPGDGAYAFDFTVRSSPQGALRGTGLVVAREREILAFIGVGPAAAWPAAEAPIRKILDTLEFFAPGHATEGSGGASGGQAARWSPTNPPPIAPTDATTNAPTVGD